MLGFRGLGFFGSAAPECGVQRSRGGRTCKASTRVVLGSSECHLRVLHSLVLSTEGGVERCDSPLR